MAFVAVRGGKPVEDEREFENPPQEEGGEEPPADEEGDVPDFDEALALNQKLKALLAEAEAADPTRRPPRGGGSGRAQQQRRAPRAPSTGSTPPGAAAAGYPPLAQAAAERGYPRESSEGINRRKYDMKVRQENAGLAVRLAGSKSCILPPLSNRQSVGQESSQSINRRRMQEKVLNENARLVTRIEQPGRTRSLGSSRQVGDSALPPGWTRGIGGRAMPPPKLRWGSKPKFDAGAWND